MPNDACDTTCLATALPKPAARMTQPEAAPVGGSRQQPAAPARAGRADGKSSGAGPGAAKQRRGVAMAMADRLRNAFLRIVCTGMLAAAFASAGAVHAALIAPGAQTTVVPAGLDDPLMTLSDPLPAGQFLLPIEVTGASDLQDWSFDLTFDATVVAPLDVGGFYQWVYQAEFGVADLTLSGITSSGLLLPGVLQGVAGFSSGVSGNGVLAFVLFEYLTDEGGDPNFGIGGPTVQPVPEPGTTVLLTAALLPLAWQRRRHDRGPRAASR